MRLFFFAIVLFAANASFAERAALVVGNAAYDHVPALDNPENDATDIAAALSRIGFDVTLALDTDHSELRQHLKDFAQTAKTAEVSLIYFAGHGIEVNKTNYLIPVNAELSTTTDVGFEALSLDLVMQSLVGASGIKIVVVDACRDNPFTAKINEASNTRSVGKGLGRVDPIGGVHAGGVLVAYAAREGTVAFDGAGRNSPYAQAFLEFVEVPGLEVSKLFRNVRDRVFELTGGRQEPFTYGALPGSDIYLAHAGGDDSNTIAEAMITAFARADTLGGEEAWAAFVKAFGSDNENYLVQLAHRRLDAIRSEDEARRSFEERNPWLVPAAGIPVSGPLMLNREERRVVQQALMYAGFYPGPIDGDFGPNTRRSIQAARLHYRLSSGTEVDRRLLMNLPDAPAIAAMMSRTGRRILPSDLPIQSEERLKRALGVLSPFDIIFGYFQGRLYIAARNPGGGWESAQDIALRAGGHLVTISDAAENRFVYDLFAGDPRYFEQGAYGIVDGPNIGFYKPDKFIESTDGWHWVTGEDVSYRNWAPGNPNNWRNQANFVRFVGRGEPDSLERRADRWRVHVGYGGTFVMEVE